MRSESEPEIPAYVEQVVQRLRRAKPSTNDALDRLLEKWAGGDASEKERIERLIVQLGKRSHASWALFVVFGIVFLVLGYHLYFEYHLSQKAENGAQAVAKVERLSEGFCMVGTRKTSCVDLTLKVYAPGRGPFQSSLTRSLSERWLSRVQPGKWVVVAIDHNEPSVVYLNEAALEGPPPAPPTTN